MTGYNSLSDTQLADLLKSGDRAAYTEIYDRYVLVLLSHAYNKTRDREMAKDAVHEVFARLWSKRSLLLIDNLPGYLFRSVRNVILNQVANATVRDRYISSMATFAAGYETTDHLVREKQLMAIIEKEIAALPAKMREVFQLSRNENLSHKEIAEKLHISEQTVSKQITNALKILRVKLGVLVYVLMLIHTGKIFSIFSTCLFPVSCLTII